MGKKRPILSVGVIFKNEIRCIERCLESLQPLRELLPCEIVMADTGSTDGSRAVAEKYADILIDFPWINDFAAARNAVMDRCTGKWYLSIDCDEWLRGDLSKIVNFFRQDRSYERASVTIRNFKRMDGKDGGNFTEFSAIRILRMSTGLRFQGAVHEKWPPPADGRIILFPEVKLYHDGYAEGVWDQRKVKRNMDLLKKKLEEDPDDLETLTQIVESGTSLPDYPDYVRRSVQGVKEKRDGWKVMGASILRHGVVSAMAYSLPELDEWVALAREMFPDSIFTRVDVNYVAAGMGWNAHDYAGCIRCGEEYFRAIRAYETKKFDINETFVGLLEMAAPFYQANLRLFLVGAYIYEHQPEKAAAELRKIDGSVLGPAQAENLARTYTHIYWATDQKVTEIIRRGWEQLCRPEPTPEAAEKRRERFLRNAAEVFQPDFIRQEPGRPEFHRHAYGVFRALEGECVLGTAASIMELERPAAIEDRLAMVGNWDELPVSALAHALSKGARFPLSPMPPEQLDRLARRLAQEGSLFTEAAEQADQRKQDSLMALNWARSMAIAAVRTQNWKDRERGMADSRRFAETERLFIPRCYNAEILTDETIWILPPMHRFGWYCSQAFEALDAGNDAGYVRLLRKGLETCPDMRAMVDFLHRDAEQRTEERRIHNASPELVRLAKQVKEVLAMYPPDDPALAVLKQSDSYQKVAWLIEDPPMLMAGGIAQ